MERLDKLLAGTGRWSRREAKDLIKAGRVSVNGAVLRDEAQKLPADALLTVDGTPLPPGGPLYLMMNKPPGLLSSTRDPRAPTVLGILPPCYQNVGLFPAGRLDQDTVGLLLLTNDGPLAHRLLSPRAQVPKRYLAEVEGRLAAADVLAFAEGITLGDGTVCRSAGLELFDGGSRCVVTLREGKHRQVRRMLASRGKPVRTLKRLSIGPLLLDDRLEEGTWRKLTAEEIEMLRSTAKLP